MTTTKSATAKPDRPRAAATKLRSLSGPLLEEARRAGGAGVTAYETQVRSLTEFQTRVADVVNVEPASSLITAYADLTRDLSAAQVSVARSLLRI